MFLIFNFLWWGISLRNPWSWVIYRMYLRECIYIHKLCTYVQLECIGAKYSNMALPKTTLLQAGFHGSNSARWGMGFWVLTVPGFAVLSTSTCQLEHCGARWIWCAWEPKAKSRRGVLVTWKWWLLYSTWRKLMRYVFTRSPRHHRSGVQGFSPFSRVVRVQWLTSTCNTNWEGCCTLNSNHLPASIVQCSTCLPIGRC